MKVVRTLGILSLSSVLLMSGCFLKKKKPQIPQQAQAPTVEPAAPPPVAPPQTEEQPTNTPPTTTETAPETVTTKPAPKPKRKKPAKTDTTTVAKTTTPPVTPSHPKIVIKEGGTAETAPQLSARLPRETVSHENLTTQQLIDSAEANLRSINHQLSKGEEDMVAQVRSFIAQSRQATTDGDSVRAHNLALKAHLLSDQLAAQ